MNVMRRRLLLLSLLIGSVATAQTDAKVARLSLVEGDVRVSRGRRDARQDDHKLPAIVWERAATDLTLKPGFSVAVMSGRAEVAFADGSIIYISANSLFTLGEVGAKHNAVDLVAGSLWLDARPGTGGWYQVTTPTDQMKVEYPEHTAMRVDGYLDGTGITTMDAATVHVGGNAVSLSPGRTTLLRQGKSIDDAPAVKASSQLTEFDGWVMQQMKQGGAALVTAAYTAPDVNRLAVTSAPGVFPLTVGELLLPFKASWPSYNGAVFSPMCQSFVYKPPGKRDEGNVEVLGGGPSAMHPGRGGAMRRRCVDYTPNQSPDPEISPTIP